jgi:tRNA (mo5U34)-methyltransferase
MSEAAERIGGLDWWHRIEVAPGVVTPGSWDLRPTADRMPWPASPAGLRALDVGTMDGFWAFELDRRGAGEVLAIDIANPARRRFEVAAELLESRAEYRELDVYDLDPADVGEFDLVVMGYVLQMVRDPLRALEAVRRVCRGHLLLLETVSRPLSLLPSPVARLDARRDGREWFVFNRRGVRKALELAGFEVEATTPILRDRYGPPQPGEPSALGARAMYALGVRGRSIAVRARRA